MPTPGHRTTQPQMGAVTAVCRVCRPASPWRARAVLACASWLLCSLQALAAPPLTLANPYHPGVDVTAYWVSEKYDGVRAHWNGQQLISRQGLPFTPPPWFTQGWPRTPLDGELWAGRGQFATAQSAISTAPASAQYESGWRSLRYMVFDVPQQTGPFSVRYPALQGAVAAIGQPWVQAVPQWRVASDAQLQSQLRQVVRGGAEGLMLRRDDAPYRGGRSDDLIKLKPLDDAEAVVVGHIPGKGKYAGMLGALEVQMPSGQRFRLGSGLRDAERAHPPALGTVVSYRFQGLHASGLPRFARFWRVRSDVPLPGPPAAADPAALATPFPSPKR